MSSAESAAGPRRINRRTARVALPPTAVARLGRLASFASVGLGWALLGQPAAQAGTNLTDWVPLFKGVDHAAGHNTPGGNGFPELQVVHAIRVDLKDPDIHLFTSPRIEDYAVSSRETAGYTVSDFLVTNRLQLAINANFFTPEQYYLPAGTAMDISGLAVCEGTMVSAQESSTYSASVTFTAGNVPAIIPTNWPPVSTAAIYTAVSGTYPLVVNGVNVGYQYRNSSGFIHQLNPRTALGISQDKRYLYLITIDGRQSGYSVGAYDYETAAWLMLLGAYNGVNMDGGGSTTLVMQDSTGQPVTLNRSSAVADSGKQRTVGSHFGLYAKPVPGFINDVAVAPDDITATVTWTTTSPASSQVRFGETTDMPLMTPLQPQAATNHIVVLSGLIPATTYYFRALSTADGSEYTSSNFVFVTTNYVTTTPVFDLTHAWTYTTANLDGISWTAPDYDDSAWDGSGPGLLWVDVRTTGPNPNVQPKNTQMPANPNNNGYPYITYYFRTHFQHTNGLAGISLNLTTYLDDGAVFYLNGAEAYRLLMDPAPAKIANDTLAANYGCSGDATCPTTFTVSGEVMKNLVTGDNVLAVEVHNYNARSPDITFGAALSITEPLVISPTLQIEAAPGAFTLTWTRSGFVLQRAAAPAGPWTDVPGPVVTSPYPATTTGQAQFFRLRK